MEKLCIWQTVNGKLLQTSSCLSAMTSCNMWVSVFSHPKIWYRQNCRKAVIRILILQHLTHVLKLQLGFWLILSKTGGISINAMNMKKAGRLSNRPQKVCKIYCNERAGMEFFMECIYTVCQGKKRCAKFQNADYFFNNARHDCQVTNEVSKYATLTSHWLCEALKPWPSKYDSKHSMWSSSVYDHSPPLGWPATQWSWAKRAFQSR